MLRGYQFKNKTKSVNRTVRIDEDIDFQLEKVGPRAARQRQLLLQLGSTKIRRMGRVRRQTGLCNSSLQTFSRNWVGFTTDEQAKELGGGFGRNLAKDLVAFLFKRVDLETQSEP